MTEVDATTRIWFVVPVYRRHEIAVPCLKQLRWTCRELEARGLYASAVVVGDEPEILEPALELGFHVVEQDNTYLGRKFNDGFEAAGRLGATHIVPCGSDNWVHPVLFGQLPQADDQIVAHRLAFIVHEDGDRAENIEVTYTGGDGIRITPAALYERLDFRPAADGARRAIDTSIIERLRSRARIKPRYVYCDHWPQQVVSFQSHTEQLNKYEGLVKQFGRGESITPWSDLARHYPFEDVERMMSVMHDRWQSRQRGRR